MTAANKEETKMTSTTFKVWNYGNFAEINIGDTVTVFKCGAGAQLLASPAN
jgi:hypothetical protein